MDSEFQRYYLHALGSRMARLLAHIEVLQEPGMLEPQGAAAIRSLAPQAQRLKHLTTLMLASDDLTSESPPHAHEPVSLVPMIATLLGEYQTVNPAHCFKLSVSDPPLVVLGDPHAIEIILEILLDNAVKYAPSGGEVEVITQDDPAKNRVTFHVRDHGDGIPLERQATLFEGLAPADHARPRRMPGHGLGLKFARRLLDRLNGEIWVESQPGQGATFSFSLPKPPSQQ